MKMRVGICVWFIVGRLCCSESGSAESARKSDTDGFDTYRKALNEKCAFVLADALEHIVRYDRLPASDGAFGDHIAMLCALPPRKEHLPLIIKLIKKSDPFLQEAGVLLASASVRVLNDYSGLEAPLCDLLKTPDLDPWVLHAIVQFAGLSNNSRSPGLVNLYSSLSEVAFDGTTERQRGRQGVVIMRNKGIRPHADARQLMDQVMLNSTKPTPRSVAILPYLEKACGTKGWEDTYQAVNMKLLHPGEEK